MAASLSSITLRCTWKGPIAIHDQKISRIVLLFGGGKKYEMDLSHIHHNETSPLFFNLLGMKSFRYLRVPIAKIASIEVQAFCGLKMAPEIVGHIHVPDEVQANCKYNFCIALDERLSMEGSFILESEKQQQITSKSIRLSDIRRSFFREVHPFLCMQATGSLEKKLKNTLQRLGVSDTNLQNVEEKAIDPIFKEVLTKILEEKLPEGVLEAMGEAPRYTGEHKRWMQLVFRTLAEHDLFKEMMRQAVWRLLSSILTSELSQQARESIIETVDCLAEDFHRECSAETAPEMAMTTATIDYAKPEDLNNLECRIA